MQTEEFYRPANIEFNVANSGEVPDIPENEAKNIDMQYLKDEISAEEYIKLSAAKNEE